ncbi:transporter substrate-binding domain-containing protein [Roseibium denhamense]|uniref:Amino acid ABC transporter substrate-binding protein, PAAT family n=1 Tax=Roseibium denhamense TaxID=76305 RepID=A0ABY1PHU4_9HYPH|nr:transporter substrate-binding domain-containing protein [Roseibium denhamense]MTI05007.1 transporter substrate-binding domain-containing protein [Roseibium denhamense]SMP33194.1 amino acid ABC transporter substrate-binding protein, PAAT family [Roseibium denhamense]
MKLIVSLVIFALAATSAGAATITVEVRHRPPELLVQDGEVSGSVYELVEAMMQDTGHTASYVEIPWKRSILRAQNGDAGVLVRHSMNDERAQFLFPMPYGFEKREVLFIRRKGSNANPVSFSDLSKYQIGKRASAYYYPEFNQNRDLRTVEATDEQTLIKMLAAGRMDLVISDDLALFRENAEAAGLPFDQHFEAASFKEVLLNGRFFSVPRTGYTSGYAEDLNCAIYKLRVTGRIEDIFKAAGLKPLAQPFPDDFSQGQQETCAG